MTLRHWFEMFAVCISLCSVGSVATAYAFPIILPRTSPKVSVPEQSTGDISKDVELQTELYRDGANLELRYRVVNHGKEAVILMNFITRDFISKTTSLDPAMAELEANGTLKISQRVLDEGSPPSCFRPIHTYTLLSPGKALEHSIPLTPNQVFWDIHGFNHIPLPNAKKIAFCLGVVPANSTNLELKEGEPRVAAVGGDLISHQTSLCSQPTTIK
jgi:hypothetical protein